MIRKRTCVAAVLVAWCALRVVAAQAPAPITVDQAVAEALDHNLSLLAERFNVNVADAAVLTAGLRPHPGVTTKPMRPDQSLVGAGIRPYAKGLRTGYRCRPGGEGGRPGDPARPA